MDEPTASFGGPRLEPETAGGYLYISDRLVQSVLRLPGVSDGDEGRMLLKQLKVSLAPRVAGGEATFEREQPADYAPGRGNREKAATLATAALRRRGQIGSLFDTPGQRDYVQLRMDGWLSPVMVYGGSAESSNRRIALFGASHRLNDGRRALVILIGSEHNLMTGNTGAPVIGGLGRNPSHMDGLYTLFDEVRENRDDAPDLDKLADERHQGPDWLIESAADLFFQQTKPSRQRPVVALARAHEWRHDVDLGPALGKYDVVVVGAALWIREVDRGVRAAPPVADLLGAADVQEFNQLRRGVFEAFDQADGTGWDIVRFHEQLEKHRRTIARHDNLAALVAMHEEWVRDGLFDRAALPLDAAPSPELVAAAARARELSGPLERRIGELVKRRATELNVAAEVGRRALAECSREEVWPRFAKWYAMQAHHEGQPFVHLTVRRKINSVASVVHNLPREREDRTNITGVIVCLRDDVPKYGAQSGDEYVLVTPDGAVYPVQILDGLRFPARLGRRNVDVELGATRFVYAPDGGRPRELRRLQPPEPDPSLRLQAAAAMFASALGARRFPHPSSAEPWADNPHLMSRPPGHDHLAIASYLPPPAWRPALLDASALNSEEVGSLDDGAGEAV